MAELAAGVVIAEQVVSSTIQGGVAAYAVTKPTMPIKATFNQIATTTEHGTRLSLARSNHSLTVVGQRAYVFGGETADGKLAGDEIHSVTLLPPSKEDSGPDYSVLPSVPSSSGGPTPAPRTKHAAAKLNVCIAVFGGRDESGQVIDEDGMVWLYNTESSKQAWETLKSEESSVCPVARAEAKLFEWNNSLVLYGGLDANGQQLKDVWHFDYVKNAWTALQPAPVATSNAALADGALYLISATESMSSDLHSLNLKDPTASWKGSTFPTNPFTPGPRPRIGGGLVAVTTGYGRNYLLYFFGARQNPSTSATTSPEDTSDPTQWSDIWTYQLPSSEPEMKVTTSLSDAIKPAKIKDAIRHRLGLDTNESSWGEVEVVPPEDLGAVEGKIHPGPRAFFGCDVMKDGVSVVIWGGLNAKGEREGDGWIVRLA